MRALFSIAAACLFAAPAFAQDASPPPQPATPPDEFARETITVGAGVVTLPEYEGADSNNWTVAPAAIGSFSGIAFQVLGNRFSADLIPTDPGPVLDIQAGPLVVVNFNRTSTDNISNAQVRALGELDTAIEVGGYVGLGKTGILTSPYDKLSVSLSYRTDVNGAHRSDSWQPSINYATPLSRKAAAGAFISAERVGRGFARYYFGVDQAGAIRSGLPVYNPRGGWKNVNIGLVGTYSITGDLLRGLKVVAGGTYGRLLGDFADSPLVRDRGSRGQWLGAVGLAYTF